MAIAIFLAIRLVVLAVIGDDVIQCEAVMRGDEIHRRPGLAAALVEKVCRGGDAGRKFRELALVPAPERPHGIAISVVPFGPPGRKVTDLVAARTAVPRLGNEL